MAKPTPKPKPEPNPNLKYLGAQYPDPESLGRRRGANDLKFCRTNSVNLLFIAQPNFGILT